MANNITFKFLRAVLVFSLSIPFLFNPSVPAQAAGTVIHVAEGGAADENCGTDWDHPCDLQYALQTRAVPGDQVWVKAGTYYPTTDGANRSASFQIKDGIKVYGGFDGTELSFAERAGLFSQTILSGDIDRATFPDTASPATDAGQIRGANSYHTVVLSGASENTLIDGFTITAGQADAANPDSFNQQGGGVLVYNGVPRLSNLIVIGNTARYGGGGIMVWENGQDPIEWLTQPVLTHLSIRGNTAFYGGGIAFGGAESQHPDICGSLENVTLANNSTGTGYGGGLNSRWCKDLRLTNVTITQNEVNANGGGWFDDYSNITMVNVTIGGNNALGGEEFLGYGSQVKGYNSILWSSNPNTVYDPTGEATLDFTYSDISGPEGTVFPGEGNINADPLLGELGDYGGSTLTLPLNPGSPAIDTADLDHCPAFDQRGVVRPQGTGCDMGAYEVRPFAMTTISLVSLYNPSVAGQTIELVATVNAEAPSSGAVTEGVITFYEDTTVLGSGAPDENGRLSLVMIDGLPVGKHNLSAVFSGSDHFEKAVSEPLEQTVNRAQTTVSITSSPNPSKIGEDVTFTATVAVSAPGKGIPTGLVTFVELASGISYDVPLVDSVATLTLPILQAGEHTWNVRYQGDANFLDSIAEGFVQEVENYYLYLPQVWR
jgi:hypothetical protein